MQKKQRPASKHHKPLARRLTKKQRPQYLPYLGLLIVLVLGILFYLKNNLTSLPIAPTSINQVGVSAGKVDLTLTPATSQVEPGGELVLTLTANPGSYKVGDITVELTYDAAKVGTPVLTQGNYLTDRMGTPKVENGKISFEYISSVSGGLATGTGTVATIKIFPQGSGTTTLAFTDKTEVVIVDPATDATIPSNMLKSASNATITITSPQASTPASANPSPTASPTVSPSTPASANPSPTPTPSAPSTQKPAKPTGLRSNCYSGGSKITLRWDAVSGASSYKLRLDQTSGSGDKSVDGLTRTDHDFDIIPDQKYSWWVSTTKNGVDSDAAKIDQVVCAKTIAAATPTPTPTPTPRPTVKPTPVAPIKASVKPTPMPPAPKTTSSPSTYVAPSPLAVGALNDIFADDLPPEPVVPAKPLTFWQKLIAWFTNLFS